ncbi:unnamed protein product [Calicophoron daubneyi]|uniref:Uncharacterized protein n=1 Tax=Calicophoron daubneyi TaxID=300641 RepID=A0AAV2T4D1_CALDB
MNRLPVCHYFQAGCCRNADACPFMHPTVKCRTFTSTGWCPYGYNCHFWHCRSGKPVPVLVKRKPCQFFMNGQCKYGDRCSFSHDLPTEDSGGMTLAEYRASKKFSNLTLTDQGSQPEGVKSCTPPGLNDYGRFSVESGHSDHSREPPSYFRTPSVADKNTQQPRLPFKKPNTGFNGTSLEGATKSELCRLQHLEIDRFVKTYPADRLKELQSDGDARIFCLRFSSTDPDWYYDVREVVLNIRFDRRYPAEPLKVTVLLKEDLPRTLVEHLNSSILSWINLKHQEFIRSNRMELYLRAFLLWLDRNLEDLFTEGLRKYKAELESQEKADTTTQGIGSIPLDTSAPSVSTSNQAEYAAPAENPIGTTDPSGRQHGESGAEHAPLDGSCTNYSPTESLSDSNPDTSSSEVENSDDSLSEKGEWVEPVTSRSPDSDETGTEEDELDEEKDDNPCSDTAMLKESSDSKLPSEELPPVPGAGTQCVRLKDFRLIGSSGTYVQRRLSVSLHCTRCRLPFTWIFNLQGGSLYVNNGDQPVASRLRSLPPHNTPCGRCQQPMELIFQASIAHAFDNRAGTLYLSGCVADDVPPKLSEAMLVCTGCNSTVKFSGLQADRVTSRRCFQCHSIMGLEFSAIQLEMLKPSADTPAGVNFSTFSGDKKSSSSSAELSRKLRRSLNSSLNPLIQDGSPLPEYGTCKHYRKSFRWLRFPCCGRLGACDVCHDDAAADGHEMEFANRMICGFCSKEQPFSATKPCVRCGKYLSGSRSSHWEGGKGCRDKFTMSRKDVKKYSQLNKTVSKGKAAKS